MENEQGRDVLRAWGEALRPYADVTKIITAQLRSSVVDTERAAVEMMARLQALEKEVQAIGQSLLREVNLDAAQAQSAAVEATAVEYTQAAGSLQNLLRLMMEQADSSEVDRRHLDQILKRVGEMQSRLDDIGAVAIQARLLSINARIEAARAGEGGRTFGIVADAVKAFAWDSQQTTEQIGRDIGEVAELIEKERARLLDRRTLATKTLDQERALLESLTEKLRHMSTVYADLHKCHRAMLTRLMASSESVRTLAQQILAGVQFQDILRQRIELVVGTLARLDEQVARLSQRLCDPAAGDEPIDHRGAARFATELAGILQQYMAATQRQSQAVGLGASNPPPSEPRIELF